MVVHHVSDFQLNHQIVRDIDKITKKVIVFSKLTFFIQGVVNGIWGSWGSWSSCNISLGTKQRLRTCNNPRPQNGGSSCLGFSTESSNCKRH